MNFECPICNDLGTADGADVSNGLCMVANCGHVFHRRCLTQWKNQALGRSSCPSCRQPCVKEWPLFGATVAEEASRSGGVCATNTNYQDLQALFSALQDDYDRVTRQLREAHEASRRRDRRSDQKDLEILRLKAEVRKCNGSIEDLETKLAMSMSLKDQSV